MRISKSILTVLSIFMLMSGCKRAEHKKTPGGMPYQVYEGKGGKPIEAGNFIKIHFTQKIQDSVYFSTHGKLPMYMRVSESPTPYDLSEVWTKVRTGDSIISTQVIDTFMARNPSNVPPNFKKGDRIMTYIKILDVFANDSLARIDNEKIKAEWLTSEVEGLAKYLSDNKIEAVKTPSGAFVQTLEQGTGNPVDSGKYVSVNYVGKTMSGKVFDSNTDSAFNHLGPLSFTVGIGQMIKGFDEGVRFMKKGGKAKIYIPSVLAYAGNPPSPEIKPYENLVFEVTVLDVQDSAPARGPGMSPH